MVKSMPGPAFVRGVKAAAVCQLKGSAGGMSASTAVTVTVTQ